MCVGINFQEYLTVEKYRDGIEVEVQNVALMGFCGIEQGGGHLI